MSSLKLDYLASHPGGEPGLVLGERGLARGGEQVARGQPPLAGNEIPKAVKELLAQEAAGQREVKRILRHHGGDHHLAQGIVGKHLGLSTVAAAIRVYTDVYTETSA